MRARLPDHLEMSALQQLCLKRPNFGPRGQADELAKKKWLRQKFVKIPNVSTFVTIFFWLLLASGSPCMGKGEIKMVSNYPSRLFGAHCTNVTRKDKDNNGFDNSYRSAGVKLLIKGGALKIFQKCPFLGRFLGFLGPKSGKKKPLKVPFPPQRAAPEVTFFPIGGPQTPPGWWLFFSDNDSVLNQMPAFFNFCRNFVYFVNLCQFCYFMSPLNPCPN